MNHTEDGYAAMLLTMALSPDREEYARPYSVQEFRRMEATVRDSKYRRIGALTEADVSGMMMYLGMSEEESYRAYTLLHRSMPMMYQLENYRKRGIEVTDCYDPGYPARLKRKLGPLAPVFYYRCGEKELLTRPSIAILGISGVRTTPEVRNAVEKLVRDATENGYGIITGGEPGVARAAALAVMQCEGTIVEVLGGGMTSRIDEEGVAEMIAMEKCTLISPEHPEAMFTVTHAIARNKLLFSLADAAFVFNTDGRRGEIDALQNRYCDWVYAWTGCAENTSLIARGAIAIGDMNRIDLAGMSRHWNSSAAEQLSFFDRL